MKTTDLTFTKKKNTTGEESHKFTGLITFLFFLFKQNETA